MRMKLLVLLISVLCCGSLWADKQLTNKFEAEFNVYRQSANEDPARESERALIDTFKKVFGDALDKGTFNFQIKDGVPPQPGKVLITIEADTDLRGPFKKAIQDMQELKTKCSTFLVRQTMEIAVTDEKISEGEENIDYDEWEKKWHQSMQKLQQQLRGSIDKRMETLFDEYKGQPLPKGRNWGLADPEWYGFDGPKKPGNKDGKEPPATPGTPRPPRYAWTWPSLTDKGQGTLRLLVDTEKRKVVRLLAHDVALGYVLTRMSAQVSLAFLIDSPQLAQTPVCLSISDCTVEEALNRLAQAAGGKVRKRGDTLVIEKR